MKIERKQLRLKTYWGDFIQYLLLFIFFILNIDPFAHGTIILAAILSIVLNIFVLLYAMFQFFFKKKRQLRDIHYVLWTASVILIMTRLIAVDYHLGTEWVVWPVLNVAISILGSVVSIIALARPVIWGYRIYQRKTK